MVITGSLPPGLSLNAATGVISGTPTAATGGPFNFEVTVTDQQGAVSAARNLSIAVSSAAPEITPGGIGPVYSTSNIIQAGSWISIYGTNLASTTATWNGDFPTTLGGVTVTIDGRLAYL